MLIAPIGTAYNAGGNSYTFKLNRSKQVKVYINGSFLNVFDGFVFLDTDSLAFVHFHPLMYDASDADTLKNIFLQFPQIPEYVEVFDLWLTVLYDLPSKNS